MNKIIKYRNPRSGRIRISSSEKNIRYRMHEGAIDCIEEKCKQDAKFILICGGGFHGAYCYEHARKREFTDRGIKGLDPQTFKPVLAFLIGLIFLGCAANMAIKSKSFTIVMLGDSTTACTLNKVGSRLPELVEKNLAQKGWKVRVINAGRNGETAKAGLERIDQDVLKYRPDVVTVMYGLNDVFKSNLRDYQKSISAAVLKLQEGGARVMLITCTLPKFSPYNLKNYVWTKAKMDSLEKEIQFIRSYPTQKGVVIYDLHSKLKKKCDGDSVFYNELLLKDCVHQSDRGNAIVAGYVSDALIKLLKTDGRKR